MTQFKSLVSLVGENPLPVYFGIRQFATPGATLVLVHSEKTLRVAKRVQSALPGPANAFSFRPVLLESAHDPESVGRTLRDIAKNHPDAALNFTGGTKVMSALAVESWRDRHNSAFYLDESAGKFRFLSGKPESLDVCPGLTLSNLCTLHGVVRKTTDDRAAVTPTDNRNVWNLWKKDSKLGFQSSLSLMDDEARYDWLEEQSRVGRQWVSFIGELTEPTRDRWLQAEWPGGPKEFPGSEIAKQMQYAAGTWLESLVADIVQSLRTGPESDMQLVSDDSVAEGQKFTISGSLFECDVLVVNDNRLRYMSVTTSGNEKLVKQKAFEAIHRARQVGGGLARTCVVSLTPESMYSKFFGHRVNARNNCQQSVDPSGYHKIFGKEDVQQWVDREDTASLARFLTLHD